MSNKIEQILSIVDIKDIREASSNYRRLFDEESILELSQSIKQHGVISPLLVRPIKEKKKTFYEVIAGSRRYKAAKMANIDELPVIIREMGDEEAFELQISENLQRKDVHPLDEAYAIVKFYEKGYTTEEVAKRLAKPASYITQRSKLSNLHFKLQPLFYEGKVSYTQAFDMARLEMEIQDNYVEKYFLKADESRLKDIDVKELIKNQTRYMALAKWDLSKEGIGDKPACKSCPKNTECNLLLFPEYVDQPKCLDSKCYDEKEKAYLMVLIEEAVKKEAYFYMNYTWQDSNNYQKLSESMGLKKLSGNGYVIEPPDAPKSKLTYEEFVKENKRSLENLDDHEIGIQYEGYLDKWKDESDDYEKELKEFKKSNKKGPWVLMLDGKYKFTLLPVELHDIDSNSNGEKKDDEDSEEINNELSEEELKNKIDKLKRIEQEKFHKQFVNDIKNVLLSSEAFSGQKPKALTETELIYFVYNLYDQCGSWNDFDEIIKPYLNVDLDELASDEIAKLLINKLQETSGLAIKLLRAFNLELINNKDDLFNWLQTLYPKSAEKLSEDLETKIQLMENGIEEKFNQLSK